MSGETCHQHASICLRIVTSVATTDPNLAAQYDLPQVEADTQTYPFLLTYQDNKLVLQPMADKGPGAIAVDFVGGRAAYRRTRGGQKELVARACGVKGANMPRIIDATAGLGRDAFVLAHLGCSVTMLECSPVIAALLADGLKRLYAEPAVATGIQLTLIHTDAVSYLQKQPVVDVVYLDPMYPQSKKDALVKKEMRLLRSIVGNDDNAEALLEAALACAQRRVVVKRPRLAPTVNHRKPDIVYSGKNSRFDVYLIHI